MMSTNNILNPANGKPVIVPSQDIVLGIYYLSQEKDNEPGEGAIYKDIFEVQQAIENNVTTVHAKVHARISYVDASGQKNFKRVETTPGRMLLWNLIPPHKDLDPKLVNRLLGKKEVSSLIDIVYRYCGQKDTVIFADKLMALGFHYAYKAGISFGKDDMIIPETKEKLVSETAGQIEKYEKQYNDGLITNRENTTK